jgi:hypothetical protein
VTETPTSTPTGTPQDLVERARQIAMAAHENQLDRAGAAYITHPERVAQRVAGDPGAEMVAWLHDVVEDTPITLDDLATEFPAEVVAAVDAISKREGEGDVYYHRVAANPLALKVKYADLDDNSSPHRLARLDPALQERLRAKYAHAREVLSEVAPRSAPPSR